MPTYELKHISDLLNVPPERRNAMLDELKVALPFFSAQLIAALAHNPGTTAQDIMPRIIWEDNGELTVTARFGSGAVSVLTTKQTTRNTAETMSVNSVVADRRPLRLGDMVYQATDTTRTCDNVKAIKEILPSVTGGPTRYVLSNNTVWYGSELVLYVTSPNDEPDSDLYTIRA